MGISADTLRGVDVKYIEVELGSDEHLAVIRECRKQAVKAIGIHSAAAHLVSEHYALTGTDKDNQGWTVEYDTHPHPGFDGVSNKTLLIRIADRIASRVSGKNLDVPDSQRKVRVRDLVDVEPPEYEAERRAKQAETMAALKGEKQ